jgi:hypothetical protein
MTIRVRFGDGGETYVQAEWFGDGLGARIDKQAEAHGGVASIAPVGWGPLPEIFGPRWLLGGVLCEALVMGLAAALLVWPDRSGVVVGALLCSGVVGIVSDLRVYRHVRSLTRPAGARRTNGREP